jgi:hypothetical protein
LPDEMFLPPPLYHKVEPGRTLCVPKIFAMIILLPENSFSIP